MGFCQKEDPNGFVKTSGAHGSRDSSAIDLHILPLTFAYTYIALLECRTTHQCTTTHHERPIRSAWKASDV